MKKKTLILNGILTCWLRGASSRNVKLLLGLFLIIFFLLATSEVGIYKRKQEKRKKTRTLGRFLGRERVFFFFLFS